MHALHDGSRTAEIHLVVKPLTRAGVGECRVDGYLNAGDAASS
ncbi:MAG: hypothetical protein QXS42_00400 [Zestosphaera sp.]